MSSERAPAVSRFSAAGLAYSDPKDGGRFRPDGQRVDVLQTEDVYPAAGGHVIVEDFATTDEPYELVVHTHPGSAAAEAARALAWSDAASKIAAVCLSAGEKR